MLMQRSMFKIVWLLGLAGFCVSGWAAELPVNVPVCETPPALDGSLTEDCWKNAAVLRDFTIVGKTNTTDATECLVTRDDTWLYFGIRCRNKTMRTMTPIGTRENQRVTADDSVEVFFDPGTDGKEYFQFMLSFANVQAQRKHAGGKRDASWRMPWRSATGRDESGWMGEMAIPLVLIVSCGDPGRVRMNVCRTERLIELDAYGAFLSDMRIGSSWQPTSKTFNEPSKFGAASGFAGALFKEPLLVNLEKMEVCAYELEGDKTGYAVDVSVRSYMRDGAAVMVEVSDSPAEGEKTTVKAEMPVKPMCVNNEKIFVPVKAFGPREVGVSLKGGAGMELQRLTASNPDVLNLMGETVLERNYYTTEKEARLRCLLGYPEGKMKECFFVVKLGNGVELARVKAPAARLELTVPLKDVPLGEQALRLILEDQAGKTIVESKTVLTKLPPKPGCEVKVNRFKGVLEKNGVPVFPFGLFKRDISDSAVKEAAQADHTAILYWNWRYEDATAITQLLAAAQSYGLDVIDSLHPVFMGATPSEKDPGNIIPRDAKHQRELLDGWAKHLEEAATNITTHIGKIRDFSNLLGCQNYDEPNLVNIEARMQSAQTIYKTAHKSDPYRPVYTAFSASIPEGGLDVADVVMYDIYMKGGAAYLGIRGYPNALTCYTLKLRQQADPAHKIVMMVLKTEGQEPLRCPRLIMPEEQRCQTYLSVIHGAKGLFYYVDTFLYTQAMWDTLADLARQFKTLAPALLSGEVYPTTSYLPVGLDIEKEVFPDVQATLFKNPACRPARPLAALLAAMWAGNAAHSAAGGYILLAANSAYHPVDVKFTVPGLNARAGVKQLFTDKKIKAEGEAFQDLLEPLGTRAYAIELKPDAVKPVALALEMTAHPDQALKLNRYDPNVDFKGRRNFAINPSFEITSPPHVLPDWVRPVHLPACPRLGLPNAPISMDSKNPSHGKYSVKETISLPTEPVGRGITGAAFLPEVQAPTGIVVSFYVKASENVKEGYFSMEGVEFDAPAGKRPYVTLFAPKADWQRIVARGRYNPDKIKRRTRGRVQALEYCIGPGKGRNAPGFLPWRDMSGKHAVLNVPYENEHMLEATGTAEFWVDAVQIEFGTEATEFKTE